MKSKLTLLFALALFFLLIAQASATGTQEAVAEDGLIEIAVAIGEHPAQPLQQDAPSRQVVLEKLNIKLNIMAIPKPDFNSKLQIWLATDQMPDLVKVDTNQIQDYVDSGSILSLTDLI
jgi:ABC-type glycerol-3-phosphate transport system substrate-binding protein